MGDGCILGDERRSPTTNEDPTGDANTYSTSSRSTRRYYEYGVQYVILVLPSGFLPIARGIGYNGICQIRGSLRGLVMFVQPSIIRSSSCSSCGWLSLSPSMRRVGACGRGDQCGSVCLRLVLPWL